MNPEAWCKCCNGAGEVPEALWHSTREKQEWILTGNQKSCGGCSGTKISVRAQEWRKANGVLLDAT